MLGDDALYPPVQYGAGWLLLVLLVVALIVAAAVLVGVLTRPRRPATHAGVPDAIAVLRGEYLAQIDAVEQEVRAGALDARHAHARLSRLMRSFVNEYSGLEAPVLTLQDLVARGVHPSLVDALGRFSYPSLFRREAPVDPLLGADAAREVVRQWH